MRSANYRVTIPITPDRISSGKLKHKRGQTVQFVSDGKLHEIKGQTIRHNRIVGRYKYGFLDDGRKVRFINGRMNTWEVVE